MPNATLEMDAVPLMPNGSPTKHVFEKEVSLASATESPAIIIPQGINSVAVTLSVGSGGQGKVQASTDLLDTVKNGTVIWKDWDNGVVTANTQESCIPVTALRLVQTTTGTTKLTVRAS